MARNKQKYLTTLGTFNGPELTCSDSDEIDEIIDRDGQELEELLSQIDLDFDNDRNTLTINT